MVFGFCPAGSTCKVDLTFSSEADLLIRSVSLCALEIQTRRKVVSFLYEVLLSFLRSDDLSIPMCPNDLERWRDKSLGARSRCGGQHTVGIDLGA